MWQAELEIGIRDRELSLVIGDITKIPADAIGNAANSRLAGGGGVDGAIHRAGGPAIMQELVQIRARIGQCLAGDAVATSAGKLPAQWVIHTVGPVYGDGRRGEPAALRSCYERCLELSDELGARTLTLPAISTGVYGYPMDLAAKVAVGAVASKLSGDETRVKRVTFVLFDDTAFRVFAAATLDIMPTLAS
ncbi:MAG: O-acetyl-ADP-ribose deacetylase [Acidobacteriia bacterium]|nr:O-acetyl-ADP-ribose deacetylase [Terriglobia bacterium]MYG02798.1 O-acetyl-ADP-ribose deacetylase [Terriglobia bacterium]MYK10577.1 O-acetyl-ADP-ribose deacetylase [Terriglobia bacterium]